MRVITRCPIAHYMVIIAVMNGMGNMFGGPFSLDERAGDRSFSFSLRQILRQFPMLPGRSDMVYSA